MLLLTAKRAAHDTAHASAECHADGGTIAATDEHTVKPTVASAYIDSDPSTNRRSDASTNADTDSCADRDTNGGAFSATEHPPDTIA